MKAYVLKSNFKYPMVGHSQKLMDEPRALVDEFDFDSEMKVSIERGWRLPPKSASGPCGLFVRIIRDYYLFWFPLDNFFNK